MPARVVEVAAADEELGPALVEVDRSHFDRVRLLALGEDGERLVPASEAVQRRDGVRLKRYPVVAREPDATRELDALECELKRLLEAVERAREELREIEVRA